MCRVLNSITERARSTRSPGCGQPPLPSSSNIDASPSRTLDQVFAESVHDVRLVRNDHNVVVSQRPLRDELAQRLGASTVVVRRSLGPALGKVGGRDDLTRAEQRSRIDGPLHRTGQDQRYRHFQPAASILRSILPARTQIPGCQSAPPRRAHGWYYRSTSLRLNSPSNVVKALRSAPSVRVLGRTTSQVMERSPIGLAETGPLSPARARRTSQARRPAATRSVINGSVLASMRTFACAGRLAAGRSAESRCASCRVQSPIRVTTPACSMP